VDASAEMISELGWVFLLQALSFLHLIRHCLNKTGFWLLN